MAYYQSSQQLSTLKETRFEFTVGAEKPDNTMKVHVYVNLTGVFFDISGNPQSDFWFLHSDLQTIAAVSQSIRYPGKVCNEET